MFTLRGAIGAAADAWIDFLDPEDVSPQKDAKYAKMREERTLRSLGRMWRTSRRHLVVRASTEPSGSAAGGLLPDISCSSAIAV